MAVVVPDQIGRTAVLAVHLENLGSYLRLPHNAPLDVETVTHFGMHHSSSLPARAGADQARAEDAGRDGRGVRDRRQRRARGHP